MPTAESKVIGSNQGLAILFALIRRSLKTTENLTRKEILPANKLTRSLNSHFIYLDLDHDHDLTLKKMK